MSEMVERVAKRLDEEIRRNVYDESLAERHKRIARAAIAAMREPTEGMASAGHRGAFENAAEDEMASGWRAMIDAALAEPEANAALEGGDA